jgi:hypothetical protein
MTIDIFIRTYQNDLEWLGYALKSLHKHVTGYRRIVITIPKAQRHLLNHLTAETVIGVDDLQDGYLGQQLTKMRAWKHTDADAIVFWDSEVVATQPIDIRGEYFLGGLPIIYKTRYSSMGDQNPWQPIVAKAVGFTPDWEYMRRMPLLYWRDTLMSAEAYIVALHSMSLEYYIRSQPYRSFSEFNVIGALAEAEERDRYAFIDTESVEMPANKADQMWSWGGITPEVKAKLSAYGLD